ncbi:MAG: two-component system response regulator [Deltaproteobacteria bacterium RIFOXYD12_FULL_50_9]|nr:MAG: two-component system response regulator [Deltaproteobacteria bacterium RIFOXYD12_FULL_50_9]
MTARKPIILCVDDEQPNLKLLENILVPRGFEVVTAANGQEALEKIKTQTVDLVLLDVMMPVMGGFEVCKKIKDDQKNRNIPVIMITALTTKKNRIKGIEAGAEEFLSKPFDQAEVLARITMLLKVKELNDKLICAYDNITSLTNFGEDIINNFNPLEFDLMSQVDSIVGRILRQKSDLFEKPETVLVRILNNRNNYEWFRYEFVFDKLERTPFQIVQELKLPEAVDSRLRFYTEAMMDGPLFQPFVEKLRAYLISVKNMVCYMSNNLSVFALNYGREVSAYDCAVLNSIVIQTLFLRSLSSQVKETEEAFEYTVQALARASELNDEDTGKHIVRVGFYCALLAKKLNMPDSFVNAVRVQALLHDVGKIHTPAEILRKPGALTPQEWKVMQQHTIHGARIIGDHARMKIGSSIAISHHERWDGSGYPDSLKGEQIPVEGRIMNIADQYDALRNVRAYKLGFDHKTTFQTITEGDGRTMPQHFDPQVLNAFKKLASNFEEVYERLKV